ncbi:MAG: phosphoglycerate mutase family protein [Gammaproteobacteria bacterium]|nr:phosphoglycerate mutase family protein [Gammaproteobacteria bacterium]
MSRLIAAFLRHGNYDQLNDTPSAMQPFGLSQEGQEQAKSGAELILSYSQKYSLAIHSIVNCSTLLRAWQTAVIIKKEIESKKISTFYVESHNELCERSVGSVANLTTDQIEKLLAVDPRFERPKKNWKSDSHYCLPFQGAESLLNSGQRVAEHIRLSMYKIKPKINEDTIMIFVGHGASFRHAAYHLKLLSFEQISQLSMFHARPLFFEYHDNHYFQHIGGEWKVRRKEDKLMD